MHHQYIQTRAESERLEQDRLAPFAASSAGTKGRIHPESRHSRRTDFQRDRDRIVNCKSFRRLEYKTQVFVNGTADHYRTRLTHTIEMASVGRTLARALRVNEDLTAAICLAHDIGHSPFGHAGERALNEIMKDHGGFDHNLQSLRWVELLEEEYPAYDGLNLTWEVRAGLRKHVSHFPGAALDGHAIGPFQQMEAQIADVADDITYLAHDVQDGMEAGLIHPEDLEGLELWQKARERTERDYPACPPDRLVATLCRSLFSLQIEDVLANAAQRLTQLAPRCPEDIQSAPFRVVAHSDDLRPAIRQFRDFLFTNMYWHPSVNTANQEAVQLMERLFFHYIEHPQDMGRRARKRIEKEGLWRTACDYVAGCTDRYALEEYARRVEQRELSHD